MKCSGVQCREVLYLSVFLVWMVVVLVAVVRFYWW